MTLIWFFVVIFVCGPVMFRLLTPARPGNRGIRALGGFAIGLLAGGYALRHGLGAEWGLNLPMTVLGLALFWGAWIAVLALGAQALRRANGGQVMRRWTAVTGALGTTMPWFGLAFASLIGA